MPGGGVVLELFFNLVIGLGRLFLGSLERKVIKVRAADLRVPANLLLMLMPMRRQDREALIGDLEEEYRTRALPMYGARKAQYWYVEQVLLSIMPLVLRAVRKIVELIILLKFIR